MTKQESHIVKYSEDLTWSVNNEHKGFRVIFPNTHKLSQRFFMRIFALRFRCLTAALMMENPSLPSLTSVIIRWCEISI